MTEYIGSLGLTTGRGKAYEKVMNPPKRPSKKRAVVVFGEGDKNVWEKPLHDKLNKERTSTTSDNATSKTASPSTLAASGGGKTNSKASVLVEDFAEKLSFKQEDFSSQMTESTEARKKEVAAQEEKMKKIQEVMES